MEAGRVQFGAEYPHRARRHGENTLSVFLIDGVGVYGGQHATFSRLSELGWIVERVDRVELKTVRAETRSYRDIAGNKTVDLPQREVPVDPGWRVPVELTADGRAALESAAKREGR